MNQYIITEDKLQKYEGLGHSELLCEIRSHPYNPQAERILNNIIELVDARIEGLDDLLTTPSEQRTESAQDDKLKEARFELGLVRDEYRELRQGKDGE